MLIAEMPGVTEYNPKRVIKRSDAMRKSWENPKVIVLVVAVVAFLFVSLVEIIIGSTRGVGQFGMIPAMLVGLIMKAHKESFVAVCEGCVYGRAMRKWFNVGVGSDKWFDIGFDKITGVEKIDTRLGGNIRINCGPDTYECMIKEPDEIISLIRERISPIKDTP